MSDLQPIADRVEIEALRGEFTDPTMDRGCLTANREPVGVARSSPVGHTTLRSGAVSDPPSRHHLSTHQHPRELG
jgi:hypothetical protein